MKLTIRKQSRQSRVCVGKFDDIEIFWIRPLSPEQHNGNDVPLKADETWRLTLRFDYNSDFWVLRRGSLGQEWHKDFESLSDAKRWARSNCATVAQFNTIYCSAVYEGVANKLKSASAFNVFHRKGGLPNEEARITDEIINKALQELVAQ